MKQTVLTLAIIAMIGIIGLGFVTAQGENTTDEEVTQETDSFEGCPLRNGEGPQQNTCGLQSTDGECPNRAACAQRGSCGCGCRG